MASKISRAKLAGHVAERIARGTPVAEAFTQLAAYLVDTRRTKEAELIIRDIEFKLLDYGMIITSVTSARPLSSGAKKDIEAFVLGEYDNAKEVFLRESINPGVIAGIRLDLPGRQFDTTIASKLEKLKAI